MLFYFFFFGGSTTVSHQRIANVRISLWQKEPINCLKRANSPRINHISANIRRIIWRGVNICSIWKCKMLRVLLLAKGKRLFVLNAHIIIINIVWNEKQVNLEGALACCHWAHFRSTKITMETDYVCALRTTSSNEILRTNGKIFDAKKTFFSHSKRKAVTKFLTTSPPPPPPTWPLSSQYRLPNARTSKQCTVHTAQEIMHRKLWAFKSEKKKWKSHRIFTFDKNEQTATKRQ